MDPYHDPPEIVPKTQFNLNKNTLYVCIYVCMCLYTHTRIYDSLSINSNTVT